MDPMALSGAQSEPGRLCRFAYLTGSLGYVPPLSPLTGTTCSSVQAVTAKEAVNAMITA